jgi:ubiquinone/menaquinone biosynthesis C-methylase UbiE
MKNYVHGYSGKENKRLYDQAGTLTEILHGVDPFTAGRAMNRNGTWRAGARPYITVRKDIRAAREPGAYKSIIYSNGSKVLEAGCGVGAQTIILAKNSPRARFTSVDLSPDSLEKAAGLVKNYGISNVEFRMADIYDLPFEDNTFDHVFVCFVLEHLKDPIEALKNIKKVLKKDGTITVIEGDHETSLFWPYSEAAMKTIRCLIDIQKRFGGDSLIGRRLYPLLKQAGFRDISVIPRPVYADCGRPHMVDGFTKKTYIAMVEGVKKQAIDYKMISRKEWDKGINDLKKSTKPGGMFYYTFFKGVALK